LIYGLDNLGYCNQKMAASFISFFENLEDPRVERTKQHKLIDIIGLTLCAVLCGCEDWEEIELFGQKKRSWLSSFLELPNGIPSHDTINRLFAALNPSSLQEAFLEWIQHVATLNEGRIINIDGKRLCHSGVNGKKAIVHMVSAWCNANNMVLGQLKTDEKSNEITAIPQLLEVLFVQGCTVTIDAMGCQKNIAAKIIEKGGDYLLALKGNQGHLLDDVKEAFEQSSSKEIEQETKLEKGHGRIEKRECRVIRNIEWVCEREEWIKLRSLIELNTERTILSTGEHQTETRYYISSRNGTAKEILEIIRSHWGIENKLHWSLDVQFGEDASRKRAGNAAENFSTINRLILNILKNEKSTKLSIKKKRLNAGWDESYLEKLIFKEI
jgi:predicted transposase YbfD/YdcC